LYVCYIFIPIASMVRNPNPNLKPNLSDCTTLFTITTKKYTLIDK